MKAKGAEVVEEGEADDELEREVMVLTVQNATRQALRELDMTCVLLLFVDCLDHCCNLLSQAQCANHCH